MGERNPGHVIVVPNAHAENMSALERDLAGEIHEAAHRVALALRQAYGCEGVSTRQHNEPRGAPGGLALPPARLPPLPGDDL